MFGDYKLYRRFEPAYASWKNNRDVIEAKRQEYLKQNPDQINQEDIQKGQSLLRAIDIMDEYSQKRAEDMEVATETVVGNGTNVAIFGGVGLGYLVGKIKPVENFLKKISGKGKYSKTIAQIIPLVTGALAGTIAAFPLYAWAARAEVGASRKGRFEAMRKDLQNPKGFAVLTREQINTAKQRAKNIVLQEESKKNPFSKKNLKTLKDMAIDSKEYKTQRKLFELELQEDLKHINDELSPEEALNAKKDQQLLTKLVEKIDIASQDYAENAELAVQTLVTGTLAFGSLFNLLLQKILGVLKIKSENKITVISQILSITIPTVLAIFSAQIQKQASRVGRFKVKQELMKNPEQLVYIDDTKTGNIKNIKVEPNKKENIFTFLKNAWKNNKEYNTYKKNKAIEEKKFYKAIENLDLTPEQIQDAKRLQKNTFRTFNAIDENSQKYAESIEALGQSLMLPITFLCSMLGIGLGIKYLKKPAKTGLQEINNISKYVSVIILSTIPSVLINAYITREQKKASRIANMMAINEMSDYRQFRG